MQQVYDIGRELFRQAFKLVGGGGGLDNLHGVAKAFQSLSQAAGRGPVAGRARLAGGDDQDMHGDLLINLLSGNNGCQACAKSRGTTGEIRRGVHATC